MPEQLGNGPQVNARRVTLSYGGKVSVLTLPPGGGDLRALRTATGDGLADTLKDMIGG